MIAFDRPPFGLAQRPLEWGPGQRLQYNPYELDGSARLAAGARQLAGLIAVRLAAKDERKQLQLSMHGC